MKRHDSLVGLSRDHHHALQAGAALRQVVSSTLEQVRQMKLEFWQQHGGRHFEVEEQVLLPAFARHRDPADPAVTRVLVEHVRIRERMERLRAGELTVGDCRGLGEQIQVHVRHEERVLFPMIEAAMSSRELETLGRLIVEAEARS